MNIQSELLTPEFNKYLNDQVEKAYDHFKHFKTTSKKQKPVDNFGIKNTRYIRKCDILAALVQKHYKHLPLLESFEIYKHLRNKNFNHYRLYF